MPTGPKSAADNLSFTASSAAQYGYAKGVNDTIGVAVQAGYSKCLNDTANVANYAMQVGYSKCLNDTQNATMLLGYCAAQQDILKKGALVANNTMVALPISALNPGCFR